jgi:hypothetical protein
MAAVTGDDGDHRSRSAPALRELRQEGRAEVDARRTLGYDRVE